jgi:hypothetical protein
MRSAGACLTLARALFALGFTVGLCQQAYALDEVRPEEIGGRPGSVIRVWPLEGGARGGASGDAFRILYRSTGLNGEPIAVSGAVFIPRPRCRRAVAT